MDFVEKDAEIEEVADGEFEDANEDEAPPLERQPSASSTLEKQNYTQFKLGAAETLLRFEELGPLDGDLEFDKLGSVRSAILNFVAAFRVFRRFLITAESLLVASISVGSTLFGTAPLLLSS